ncbi:MAG: response regulator [Bacteriovorax sp.]|nr:response regulator [Bacteriovorax sp.]
MKKNYRILIADDEKDIRDILFEIITDEGYECVLASNGLMAKQILEKEKFDLLITDFRMPEMDGVQLLDWCRQSKIHLPVIFISANAELLPKERIALEDCCSAVIDKPMEMDEVLHAIKEAQTRIHDLHC